ncbi:MAG: gamma-glutamylcyclotransferase family protein [Pseudomonadota bacterium]
MTNALSALHRLATYGTFPPGRANHHVVAPIGGIWREGYLEGRTRAALRGRWKGYAGFEPEPAGPHLAAWLLEAAALPDHWERLDRFEGDAFQRLTVDFHLTTGETLPAQVYVLGDTASF